MSAYRKSVTKHCPIRAAAHILLLLTLLWAFLGTVDGPTVNLSSNAGGIVYSKGSSFHKLEHGAQPGLALIGVFQEEPPVMKYQARAPSSWIVASTWPPRSPSIGLLGVGDPHAVMPESAAMRRTRSMCGRSETKTALL